MGMDWESWHHGLSCQGLPSLGHSRPLFSLPQFPSPEAAWSLLSPVPTWATWSLISSFTFLRENVLLTLPSLSFLVCKAEVEIVKSK